MNVRIGTFYRMSDDPWVPEDDEPDQWSLEQENENDAFISSRFERDWLQGFIIGSRASIVRRKTSALEGFLTIVPRSLHPELSANFTTISRFVWGVFFLESLQAGDKVVFLNYGD